MLRAPFLEQHPIADSDPPRRNAHQTLGTYALRMREDFLLVHYYLPPARSKPYSTSKAFTFS